MSISSVSAASLSSSHLSNTAQVRPNQPAASANALTATVQTAAQETAETPVQTAQEAGKGDAQAQRILAAHSTPSPTVNTSGQTIGTVVNTKA